MQRSQQPNKAELITSIATAIIAVIALFISIWDHIQDRQFAKLSVVPYLTGGHHIPTADPDLGVVVSNQGLGPARILNVAVIFDGKEMPLGSLSTLQTLHTNVSAFTRGAAQINLLTPGCILETGKTFNLIYATSKTPSESDAQLLRIALTHIAFKFEYESLYHERSSLLIPALTGVSFE